MLLVPILWIFRKRKKIKSNAVELPNYNWIKKKKSFLDYISNIYFFNKILIIILLVTSLSRPQRIALSEEVINQFGIDIILTIDISNSMLARDLKPDRFSVLKETAKKFIKNRTIDRIGIVVFAGEAVTKIPLTSDKQLLISTIDNLQTGFLEHGTSIGVGLATSINHLKHSQAKSRIIVLMTDGENTSGLIDPYLAGNIAKSHGIKVYTVGIGTTGQAEMPIAVNPITGELQYQMMNVEIGETLLIEISKETGGKYFRAHNEIEFQEIYKRIDQLEKSKIEGIKIYNSEELYKHLIKISFFLLCIELIMKLLMFKVLN